MANVEKKALQCDVLFAPMPVHPNRMKAARAGNALLI